MMVILMRNRVYALPFNATRFKYFGLRFLKHIKGFHGHSAHNHSINVINIERPRLASSLFR